MILKSKTISICFLGCIICVSLLYSSITVKDTISPCSSSISNQPLLSDNLQSSVTGSIRHHFEINNDETLGIGNKDEVSSLMFKIINQTLTDNTIRSATLSIVKDGELFLIEGYNNENLNPSNTVNPNITIFQLGGISDIITAVAVMTLVDQGAVDLNTDINNYISAFEIPDTFDEPITLYQLLTHTAGFDHSSVKTRITDPTELPTVEEFVIQAIPERIYPPGIVASQSHYGYALVCYIIEQVTEMTFEDYIKQAIFTPLGMNYSTFINPLPSYLESFQVQGYNLFNSPHSLEYPVTPTLGSLYSSAGDMAKFMLMLLNNGSFNGKTIISVELIDIIFNHLYRSHPLMFGVACGLEAFFHSGMPIFEQRGSISGYRSGLFLAPEENLGFFIVYNSEIGTVDKTFSSFKKEYYPYDYATSPDSVFSFHPNYKERVGQYSGIYILKEKSHTSATPDSYQERVSNDRNGHLSITLTGNAIYVETEPMLFRSIYPVGWDVRITFLTDQEGKIAYMYTSVNAVHALWYKSSVDENGNDTPGFSILILIPVFLGFYIMRRRSIRKKR